MLNAHFVCVLLENIVPKTWLQQKVFKFDSRDNIHRRCFLPDLSFFYVQYYYFRLFVLGFYSYNKLWLVTLEISFWIPDWFEKCASVWKNLVVKNSDM